MTANFTEMQRKARQNRQATPKPRMKPYGKEIWAGSLKGHLDKLPSWKGRADELAQVFADDEEDLVDLYNDAGGDMRTILRMLVFNKRLGLLFVRERRVELEARVRALETSVPAYRGIWKQRTPYARGTLITYAGSMWRSNEDANEAKPGSDESWVLCVKKGRDARRESSGEQSE